MLALLLLASSLQAQAPNGRPQAASMRHQAPAPPPPPAVPASAPVPAPPPLPPTPAQSPAQRAKIDFNDGQLSIAASNSSLNQILREVSRLTGIKVTGGVAEERVFGNYGPAKLSDVLGQLLDGTGSNMLLLASEENRAPELILTPRTGGATPPNPNAARFDDNADADNDAQQAAPPPQPQPQPSQAESQSQPTPANPVAAPIAPPAASNENPGAAQPAMSQPSQPATSSNDSDQQSPNGVKTPQQIYDQLMRLRGQQQSQPK